MISYEKRCVSGVYSPEKCVNFVNYNTWLERFNLNKHQLNQHKKSEKSAYILVLVSSVRSPYYRKLSHWPNSPYLYNVTIDQNGTTHYYVGDVYIIWPSFHSSLQLNNTSTYLIQETSLTWLVVCVEDMVTFMPLLWTQRKDNECSASPWSLSTSG